MSTTFEYPQHLVIDTGDRVNAVTFTANGEYLVGGSSKGVRVWRVKDGRQVATMPAKDSVIQCVAASNDERWIAAGTFKSGVFVWDTRTTYEQAFLVHEGAIGCYVDFSPDSTRLVVADDTGTATIWDIAARKKVRTFGHSWQRVRAVKYSPRGDRVATATVFLHHESVRLWDSYDGRLLVDVEVPATGLLWCNNHLFIQTKDSKIRQIIAATGSTVSEWPIPCTNPYTSRITHLQHGTSIACSANEAVTFWDTATRAQLGLIRHTHEIRSIASSSDGQFLAIVAEKNIIVKELFRFILEPELGIDSAAWEHGRLMNGDKALCTTFPTALENRIHYVLASRALVRARLGEWDAALVDAKESIKVHRSFIGYIAKCVALVGKGERDEGFRVCDIAFQHFHPDYSILLPLIKAVVVFVAGDHPDAISRMDRLITDAWVDPALYIVQAYIHLLHGNKYMESSNYERAIELFEDARIKLGKRTRQPPLILSLISGWRFDDLAITIQQRLCEALFAAGRTKEACESVLRMVDEEINTIGPVETWVSDFKDRCRSKLEDIGDSAMNAGDYDEVVSQYTAALLLDPPSPQGLLVKRSNAWVCKGAWKDALNDAKGWVRLMRTCGSWKDVLAAADGFMLERLVISCAVCEDLERTGHVTDAAACFHQLSGEPVKEIEGGLAIWTRDFKRGKLENLGDSAMNAKKYDEAVSQYTVALLLDPPSPQDLLVKRSRAYVQKGKWEDALNDANEVIKLDPSSPLGYERKHAALLGMKHNDDAIAAFNTMLSKMSESSDLDVRERSCHYVRPERTKEVIRTSIENAIRGSPLVLIHTSSGRLCGKSEQAAAFESTPGFTALVASTTTSINHILIKQVVGEFYRYVMLSHTWQDGEPPFEEVIRIAVYNLGPLPTHEKLKMFCKIVRDEGLNWAWYDACCINKSEPVVVQKALNSVFKWYEGSAMTIIYLNDVDQLAKLGALSRSMWNTRAWALQEYHASKVVRIYTRNWTPYLGLNIHNHKESLEIISEMEQVTGVSARVLMSLRPGLSDIREKLRLASTRRTTRVEDTAYSLLGIFSMVMQIMYGEGDSALGRLLSQLLTSSGDISILAWNGRSGSFNSCLPASIAVFSQPLASHIPPAIPDAEMEVLTAPLHASKLDLDLVTRLYEELDRLPVPIFAGQRMKLPCLIFGIRLLSRRQDKAHFIFHAEVGMLGTVEIMTKQRLTPSDSLYLVHPWIDFLLDRHASENIVEITPDEDETFEMDEFPSLGSFPDFSSTSHADLVDDAESPMDAPMKFLARLRRPFGALLLAPAQLNETEHRRIATESLIIVQVQEITLATLHKLIQSIRVLDVL